MSSTGLFASLGRSWWVLVLYGVIAVLFGIGAFVWPGKTAVAIAWAFGVMALAEGVISLIALFRKDVPDLQGLAGAVCAGLDRVRLSWPCCNPLAVAGILLMFLAAWLLVAGIYRIVLAIRIRKEIEGEWLIALSGRAGDRAGACCSWSTRPRDWSPWRCGSASPRWSTACCRSSPASACASGQKGF